MAKEIEKSMITMERAVNAINEIEKDYNDGLYRRGEAVSLMINKLEEFANYDLQQLQEAAAAYNYKLRVVAQGGEGSNESPKDR